MTSLRFAPDAAGLTEAFAKNGFVAVAAAADPELVRATEQGVNETIEFVSKKYLDRNPNASIPYFEISRLIVEHSPCGRQIMEIAKAPGLIRALARILGPDLQMLNHQNLWINDERDFNPVTYKTLHQEMWSGSGIDDLTVWTAISKPSAMNTLAVVPGSHLWGLLPNRNRSLTPIDDFDVSSCIALDGLEPGDAIVFHPLLLHGTAGRGAGRRLAMSTVYKPTLAATTRKYATVGWVSVAEGPMTRIRDSLANDFFTPLRTYGGPVSNAPTKTDIGPEDLP
jgi:hypothetical protein